MNTRADLLMVDEPTNHLDLASIEVTQKTLKDLPGAVMFISHDRSFIRAVATDVLEFKDGQLANRYLN